MSIPYWEREEAIKKLYEYEESNNIPDDERLTFGAYAEYPEIETSPQKKMYIDIRNIIHKNKMLGL